MLSLFRQPPPHVLRGVRRRGPPVHQEGPEALGGGGEGHLQVGGAAEGGRGGGADGVERGEEQGQEEALLRDNF